MPLAMPTFCCCYSIIIFATAFTMVFNGQRWCFFSLSIFLSSHFFIILFFGRFFFVPVSFLALYFVCFIIWAHWNGNVHKIQRDGYRTSNILSIKQFYISISFNRWNLYRWDVENEINESQSSSAWSIGQQIYIYWPNFLLFFYFVEILPSRFIYLVFFFCWHYWPDSVKR